MKNQETEWLLHEKYQGVESEAFDADCARLAAGEPLGYLIGHVPFLDCTIYLDSHPLIPRVETEFWVEKAIHTIQAIKQKVRGLTPYFQILDLCAGSGAIGVAVAKAVPEARVTFAELDPTHLPTIQKNILANVPDSHTIVVESDLFLAFKSTEDASVIDGVQGAGEFLQEPYVEYGDEKIGTRNKEIRNQNRIFDFILTNPPYIDAAANTVATDVTAHEPHLALFGGTAGMDIIARIIEEAPSHLTANGQLWIEHEPAQVEAISTLARVYGFTIVTHPDQYDTPRFSVLTMAQ